MLTRDACRIAVQNTLVCLFGYLGGYYLTTLFRIPGAALGGLWALVSGIIVLQATRRETWASAWLRLLGTSIGAVISGVYLFLLPFSPLGMALTIGVTVLLCQFIGIPDHARLAALTVAIIMVVASLHPGINPVVNALLRFIESCIGTVLAVVAAVLWPEPTRA